MHAHGQTFGLRIIEPGTGYQSTITPSVSADGSVIGFSYHSRISQSWPANQGIFEQAGVRTSVSTFTPALSWTALYAVSGSGRFGAGTVPPSLGSNSRPAHYDFENQRITHIDLPSDDYFTGNATGISHTGDVIVGRFAALADPITSAFRWTAQGGVQLLQPAYPGDQEVFANGVSGDGDNVVGVSQDAGRGVSNAMRWDATGAGIRLPSLDGDYFTSTLASGISADGRIVVGSSDTSWFGSAVAVVWDENNQIHRLGGGLLETALGSQAMAANADGTVIGGVVTIQGNTNDAMIWTEQTQGILLSEYIALFGIDIPVGVRLHGVSFISADGRTFAGSARLNGSVRTFVVHVPAPAGGVILAYGLMFAGQRKRLR
jgi:uncharacterized membrane protein